MLYGQMKVPSLHLNISRTSQRKEDFTITHPHPCTYKATGKLSPQSNPRKGSSEQHGHATTLASTNQPEHCSSTGTHHPYGTDFYQHKNGLGTQSRTHFQPTTEHSLHSGQLLWKRQKNMQHLERCRKNATTTSTTDFYMYQKL